MHIDATRKDAYRLFHEGAIALSRASQYGMRIDVDYVTTAQQDIDAEIAEIYEQLNKFKFIRKWKHRYRKDFNPLNHHQLSKMLYKVEGITPEKETDTGKGSTDDEALKQLEMPELDLILRMRKITKLKDTFLEGLLKHQEQGYVHPFFNLHTTVTYRSSSDKPNFQNIPKRDTEARDTVRNAIYPRPGRLLLEVDYSGIEVRVAACYHKDPKMIQYIEDPESDMHGDMAEQIFFLEGQFDKHEHSDHKMLRAAAKNGFVFPQFYGDYYKGCAINLAGKWAGLPQGYWRDGLGVELPSLGVTISTWLRKNGIRSYDDFERHIEEIENDFWNRRFSAYKHWKDQWWQQYQHNGYIDSLTGFRYTGVLNKKNAINYPIQGSAFHCLLWSFIQIEKYLRMNEYDTRPVGQIHDAIVLDVHPDELEDVTQYIRQVMCDDLAQHWDWINVPIDIEADISPVDGSWAEQEEYPI